MKQFILVTCIICFLGSCKEKINSVQDVMTAMAPPEQGFTIDPSTDNVIKGEKGTQIFIPANALRFPDGTAPTGKVNVELKEFFSISDFVSNSLSTTSDSFLLETAGMLYISATADGKELVIDNSKSYAIAFPKNDSTRNMELFYGDSSGAGSVNWQPVIRGEEGSFDSTLTDSTLYVKKITVCGYSSSIGDDNILYQINHRDGTLFRYVENNFKPADTALINALCERREIAGMAIEINAKGKVSKVDFDVDSYWYTTSVTLRKTIADFMYAIPEFRLGSMAKGRATHVVLSFCCHNTFDRDKYNERFDKKYSQYRDKAVQKIDPTELNFYVMSATKFGWVNCDRFIYDSLEKVDYIVKIPETKDANVMIVFDEINSIMSGNTKGTDIVFENVPLSSKIKVIGISYKDGKPLLSKMPAVVSKQPIILSGFKEFTLKELEKELNN